MVVWCRGSGAKSDATETGKVCVLAWTLPTVARCSNCGCFRESRLALLGQSDTLRFGRLSWNGFLMTTSGAQSTRVASSTTTAASRSTISDRRTNERTPERKYILCSLSKVKHPRYPTVRCAFLCGLEASQATIVIHIASRYHSKYQGTRTSWYQQESPQCIEKESRSRVTTGLEATADTTRLLRRKRRSLLLDKRRNRTALIKKTRDGMGRAYGFESGVECVRGGVSAANRLEGNESERVTTHLHPRREQQRRSRDSDDSRHSNTRRSGRGGWRRRCWRHRRSVAFAANRAAACRGRHCRGCGRGRVCRRRRRRGCVIRDAARRERDERDALSAFAVDEAVGYRRCCLLDEAHAGGVRADLERSHLARHEAVEARALDVVFEHAVERSDGRGLLRRAVGGTRSWRCERKDERQRRSGGRE